jgi:uncharacterized protein involved in response to NO
MNDESPRPARFVLFAYGFRPFFLAALAFGGLSIAAWLLIRTGGITPLPGLPPSLWHGHEMLFGFVGAAIAGFLLTAVPSWTGARGFAGWPLIVLSSIWLAGRIAFASSNYLSLHVVAVAELAFLPALAILIAVPLLRARNRNTPLLLVLGALWFTDATFLCAIALGDIPLASKMLRLGINIVLLLITVIGGRIVPAFTANALRRRGLDAAVRDNRWIGRITIATMLGVVAVDALSSARYAVAAAAGIAALAQLVRLAGWGGTRVLREPIVWVLHLAYLWLPLGLALKAIHFGLGAAWSSGWLHALTIGGAATMVVAVMTRASLGHTGRELIVSPAVVFAYVALGVAALLRAFAVAWPEMSEWIIRLAALLWIAAFAAVFVVYLPILVRPRVDGRSG